MENIAVSELSNHKSLETTFSELTEKWRKETQMMSSITKKSKHPAYQEIISMGTPVLPLILRELKRQPDHWFWALVAISEENPVSAESNFDRAVETWLEWGKNRGLI